jgi:hypothetical protein
MKQLLCMLGLLLVLHASSRAQDVEVLPIAKLTISGFPGHEDVRLPFLTHHLKITKYLGKPDSISSSEVLCGTEAATHYFYKGIGFDLDPHLGVYPRELNLAKHATLALTYKGVTLSHKTTIADFRKYFPLAAKELSTSSETWLLPFKDSDDRLRFQFDTEGHLSVIEYWIPC